MGADVAVVVEHVPQLRGQPTATSSMLQTPSFLASLQLLSMPSVSDETTSAGESTHSPKAAEGTCVGGGAVVGGADGAKVVGTVVGAAVGCFALSLANSFFSAAAKMFRTWMV